MDDFTKRRIEKVMQHYMESTIEEQLRSRRSIGYALEGNDVTLVEQRPSKDGNRWIELPVAQFRLDAGGWRAICSISNLKKENSRGSNLGCFLYLHPHLNHQEIPT